MLILISDSFDSSLPGKLSVFGEVTTDKERLPEADVVLVRAKTKCTPQWIDSAKNLKLIIRGGVGTDNIDKAYAQSKGIIVKNTPKASSIAVAELAFALMLSIPNKLSFYDSEMKNGQWRKDTKRTELYGKKLALIGYGNIASEVGKRAMAFGMDCIAYARHDHECPFPLVHKIEDAVKDADYISIHLPATDETRGLFNSELIAKMERKPAIINTGRGAVVVADDIKAALDSGAISWYATDVYPSDPVDYDNYSILKSDRVTLTPHVGANSNENLLRIGDEVCELINSLVKEGKI